MTLREALIDYLEAKGIRGREVPAGQFYPDDWFRFYVGKREIRLVRLGRAIRSIAVHDAHHLLTGYGTDMRGEAEIAAWELASGGCGRHWVMWLDRVVAMGVLIPFYPRASLRAFQRGRRQRNFYRADFEAALDGDLETARGWVSRTERSAGR